MSNATMSEAARVQIEAAELLSRATHDACKLIESSDELEPLEKLQAIAGLLDELDCSRATIFDLRRKLVKRYNRFLSYALMAENLGCSKALIHQIVHGGNGG